MTDHSFGSSVSKLLTQREVIFVQKCDSVCHDLFILDSEVNSELTKIIKKINFLMLNIIQRFSETF